VLATDANDVGASFTNYGMASVDIAAPGVSTLSTVPTAACSLCDASGYRALSGTSMASPHVAAVLKTSRAFGHNEEIHLWRKPS
jgi:subtilisin family serine protease